MYGLAEKDDGHWDLKQREERLRAIIGTTPDCIKILDEDLNLLYMNEAGLEMIEADSLGQVSGLSVTKLLDRKYSDEFKQNAARVFAGEKVCHKFEIIGLRGTRRWMEQVAVPFHSPTEPDRIIEMLAVTRDVTAQVEAVLALQEEKLKAEAANIAKSQFLATMSHEIRTPMNGIMGMLQLLLSEPTSDLQRQRAEIAWSSADSLLKILNDILDYSKIQSGAVTIESAPYSPRETVNAVIALLTPKAEEKGLAVEAWIDAACPEQCVGDADRIRQILTNLCFNAIKFTERGKVSIGLGVAAGADGEATLKATVRDTGIGIEADKIDVIFDRFAQIDGSMTRAYNGAGLGLAISKQLVEQMGGDISVDSTPGEGSTFTVVIPTQVVGVAAEAEEQVDAAAPRSDNNLRVLVVEDNKVNQQVLQAFLELSGHDMTLAENGRDAVDAMAASTFDVVLMDIQMPLMDGLSAAKEIKAMPAPKCDVPIIALTAHAMVEDRRRYDHAGMADCLVKPIDARALEALLDRIAGGREPSTPDAH